MEKFVENDSDAPDIAFVVVSFAFQNLGRHVLEGPGRLAQVAFEVRKLTGDSEVTDFEFAFFDQDVLGFEITK